MNKKFTLGVIAGMSSLALAVPMVADIASAETDVTAETSVSEPAQSARGRAGFGQPTLQEMIDNDQKVLDTIDTLTAAVKTNTQIHLAALKAAQGITDTTAQKAAIKKAQDDFRAAMQATMKSSNMKGFMMPFGPHDGLGRGGMGMAMKADLAAKLGMTEAELKAALDAGKTIQQIATEKGVTLPTPPMGGRGHGMHMMKRGFGAGAQQ